MIHTQLKSISGNPQTIQFYHEAIYTLLPWVIWSEISKSPPQLDEQLHLTQSQLLNLWSQIHITSSALVTTCLDIFLSCIKIDRSQAKEVPGLEQVARVTSLCLLHVISGMNPASTVIKGAYQHYISFIPPHTNFEDLLCYHTISAIHALFFNRMERHSFQWMNYKPSPWEHTLLSNTLVRVAHRMGERKIKVPCWILRFVLHSLSLDPLPPTSVIIDCLTIIAIGLGCHVSSSKTWIVNERYVHVDCVLIALTHD